MNQNDKIDSNKKKDRINRMAGVITIIGTILIGIGQPVLFSRMLISMGNFIFPILHLIFVILFQIMVVGLIFKTIKNKELGTEEGGVESVKKVLIGLVGFNLIIAMFASFLGVFFPFLWVAGNSVIGMFSLIYYSGFIVTLIGTFLYQKYY